ncbi:MAG: hypothetical protein BWY30_00925 [Tenericutes bacterium ADurb.Bin239]|jgi:hypothetical protein|nr:MAG: hypothetical protein BWY30_00925 [Tenericutes bacterium ADurb.Bin239]
MFAIFEKYSQTSERTKKTRLHPLKVPLSMGRTFDMIEKYFASLEPLDTIIARDYFDICILDNKGFEISVQLQTEGGNTYINASVFGDDKRGKTRRRLYDLLDELRILFKDYIGKKL